MKTQNLTLVRYNRYSISTRIVEFLLKGKILDKKTKSKYVYNSYQFNNKLKASYRTKVDSGHICYLYRRNIYDESYFKLIYSICNNNSLALINLKHPDKFISKLSWLKLHYKNEILVKEKTICQTQKKRCMN